MCVCERINYPLSSPEVLGERSRLAADEIVISENNHSTLSSTLLRGMPVRLKMAKLVIPSSMRGCSRTLKRRKDTRGGLTSQSGDESGAISGDN